MSSVAPRRPWAQEAVTVGVGVGLLALSAQVRIPVGPVPFTMQTFVVLFLATAVGQRLGTTTVAAYLVTGAAGRPVFSGRSGASGH